MAGEVTEDREPPGPADLIGQRIGHYRITRELGRGGMGVVCLAVHEEIGQRAAVKILLRSGKSALHDARFLIEARAASRVHHPGLVKIFDFGRLPGGSPYILMEYLEGELLAARLLRGGLVPSEALRITSQLAQALQALHDDGIVHRDLKPENVMLVKDAEARGGERAKVLDFGIAKLTSGHAGPGISAEGHLLGTTAYMSPEQCAAEPIVDGKSDVYALGAVLYELLSGAPPFTGPPLEVLEQHIHAEPPPLRPTSPELALLAPEVEGLVLRMLRKIPARRPTMSEVSREIEALARAATLPAPESPPASRQRSMTGRRRRRWQWLALGAGLVGVLGLGGAALHRMQRPREPARLSGMVWLAGGSFLMGSTPEEIAAECQRLGTFCQRDRLEREQPPRQVKVSPFYLDAHEVTNQEFAGFLHERMLVEVREDKEHKLQRFVFDREKGVLLADLWPDYSGITRNAAGAFVAKPGQERYPVAMVTWEAAWLYCRAQGKRLPTEAEWELAARGLSRRRHPWGDEAPRCDGVVYGRDVDLPCKSLPQHPEPVGTAAQDRTPEGVSDLGGNVAEWVQDQFRLPYYPPCGACVDPRVEETATSPQTAGEDVRVFRGGAWSAADDLARGASRNRLDRERALFGLGFRCASN